MVYWQSHSHDQPESADGEIDSNCFIGGGFGLRECMATFAVINNLTIQWRGGDTPNILVYIFLRNTQTHSMLKYVVSVSPYQYGLVYLLVLNSHTIIYLTYLQ